MSAVAACLVLLGAMTALVVFTMAVENWSRLIQPLPSRGRPDVPEARRDDIAEIAIDVTADEAAASALRFVMAEPVPVAGRPEGAVIVTAATVQLRDAETADVLAGLLFAAYAASRRTAADRAAAWVTASATPPSADPERFGTGVNLRGKPARVAELLAIRDGGATWVTLQPTVDIAKGVARSPVTQPTLAGLVSWWERTHALPAVIRPTDARRMADAIGAVLPQLDETPWRENVGQLHDALRGAVEDREPLLVDLGPTISDAPTPGAPRTAPRSRRAHVLPTGPAGRS